ncbi:MAG: diguanylate cyclase [SAR324 cluster bacterium]|nr:diguanylate cyclase [SAR324 cluster bacterium]
MTQKIEYRESDIPQEYFSQFRDIIFLVDQTGKILYQDRIFHHFLTKAGINKERNITSIFPIFYDQLKKALDDNKKKQNSFESFALINSDKDFYGRCFNLGGMLSHKITNYFLVTLHNTDATGFMIDLLSDIPREYIRNFTRENIKQFIYFSNEMKSFVEVVKDQLGDLKESNSLSHSAVQYIGNQINYFRNFYLQQSELLQSDRYEYTVNVSNDMSLSSLVNDMAKLIGKDKFIITKSSNMNDLKIRGEQNWLAFAFKNIASFITSQFPEIDPVKVAIIQKPDRNQVYIEFDFASISDDHKKFLFHGDNAGEHSMFYNCYNIVDMNRGNLRFDEKNKVLNLTLPLLRRDSSKDKVVCLIVDVDWNSRKRCMDTLMNLDQNVAKFEASDPQEALRMVADIEPDIVVMDPYFYADGDPDIRDIIESIYLSAPTKRPDIVLFSQFNDIFDKLDDVSQLFNINFLRKEITDVELSIYLAQMISNARNLKILGSLLQNVRRASEIDSLTGAFNRSFYDQLIKVELAKAQKNGTYLSFIMADIDNFKHYNDVNGHLAGDRLLREFVDLLKDKVRATDYVTRYGGEEFIVVLINALPQSVMEIANKLRLAIEEHKFKYQMRQPSGNLTASFGVSNFPKDGDSPDTLFKVADVRLYASKQAGRNRVVGN